MYLVTFHHWLWQCVHFASSGFAGSWEVLPPIVLSLCGLQTEPGGSALLCRRRHQSLLCQWLPQVSFSYRTCTTTIGQALYFTLQTKDETKPCQTGYTRDKSHIEWLEFLWPFAETSSWFQGPSSSVCCMQGADTANCELNWLFN